MLSYIFISPLGWSEHIWNKVISEGKLNKQDYDTIEFLDKTFEEISIQNIDKIIEEKISHLSTDGYIVTSSYGTVVLLSYLYRKRNFFPNIIIIDGLDKLPSKDELSYFLKQEKNAYFTKKEYYNAMLSDDEKNDSKLLEILDHNLSEINGIYYPKLSSQNIFYYLSLYANSNPISMLEEITPYVDNLKIFSHIELEYQHEYIDEEKHLLMLKEPDTILKALHLK